MTDVMAIIIVVFAVYGFFIVVDTLACVISSMFKNKTKRRDF